MRLAPVGIGGKLALVIGFGLSNLVFGNSLSYYYGYSTNSAGFGQAASSDPYASQSVSYAQQASLVSSQSSNQTWDNTGAPSSYASAAPLTSSYNGFSVLAATYGYAAPAAAQTTSYASTNTAGTNTGYAANNPTSSSVYSTSYGTSTAGNASSSTVNTAPIDTYASTVAPAASTSTTTTSYSTSSSTGYGVGAPATTNNNTGGSSSSSGGSTYNPYTAGAPTTSNNGSGLTSVVYSVTPNVANQITNPGPTTSMGGPVNPSPNVYIGGMSPSTLSAPEPSTWMSVSAGLGLLLLQLRRRRK